MAKQTDAQKHTIDRVMHEFKEGELRSSTGGKVINAKQAIAIALSEAGTSNQASPKENKRNTARTRGKEKRGETAMQQIEGRGAKTRGDLYAEAQTRKIPGRSTMSKAELERALR